MKPPAFRVSPLQSVPFFFSSRRRHTRCSRDWSSDVCSSDLILAAKAGNSLRTRVAHRGGHLPPRSCDPAEATRPNSQKCSSLRPHHSAKHGWICRRHRRGVPRPRKRSRSEEHTSELQSRLHLVCRLLLEKKNISTYRS